MTNNFDSYLADLPLADEAAHRLMREILEERSLRSVIILGEPGIGKSFHHEVDVPLAIRRSDGYKTEHRPGGFFDFQPDRSFYIFDDVSDFGTRGYRHMALELIDPDKGLPEWQKRRNASARAKDKLIAKMKKSKA